ncbi:MAG: VOC family protein [Acidobacteria bacterium]|nr:VOC family protein [Acidobacteriota bacterium]
MTHVTVLVADQDRALDWYTRVLGLEKRQDDAATIPGFRWVTVAPKNQKEPEIVLLKAEDKDQELIGRSTMWVFETDDCSRTYSELKNQGVMFVAPPQEAPWGVSAVFQDLYGNRFNLAEHR